MEKTYCFGLKNITYLEDGRGVPRALTKKQSTPGSLKILGTPSMCMSLMINRQTGDIYNYLLLKACPKKCHRFILILQPKSRGWQSVECGYMLEAGIAMISTSRMQDLLYGRSTNRSRSQGPLEKEVLEGGDGPS